MHPSPPPPHSLHIAHTQAVSCVWEKGPASWARDPQGGKVKSQSPLTPPLPSPPAQGKLSSSSSAISLANSKSCCSRSRRSWGKRGSEARPRAEDQAALLLSAPPRPTHPQARSRHPCIPAPDLPEPSLHPCPRPSRNLSSFLPAGKFYLPVILTSADSKSLLYDLGGNLMA